MTKNELIQKAKEYASQMVNKSTEYRIVEYWDLWRVCIEIKSNTDGKWYTFKTFFAQDKR